MTESILGFILLCFGVALVYFGDGFIKISAYTLATLIGVVVVLIVRDARAM